MKKVKTLEFVGSIGKGWSSFDFLNISDKKLVIPEYNPKSIYSELDLTNQYDKLKTETEKKDFYKQLWTESIYESSFDKCDFIIEDIDFKELSKVEKTKFLYLSYHKKMGYYYLMIWYVNDLGEELPMTVVQVNGLDFSDVNDLKYVFNVVNQSCVMAEDFVGQKLFADMYNTAVDDSRPKIERLYSLSTEEMQEASNNYYSKMVKYFIANAPNLTLLIPEEEKTEAAEQAMEKWTYSKYKFVPQSYIEEKRKAKDELYAYLRYQRSGAKFVATTSIIVLSTNNDQVLYQCVKGGASEDNLNQIIPLLIEDIESYEIHFDSTNTLTYKEIQFEDRLPTDLMTSQLVYVNLTKEQNSFSGWINRSFERKMKSYPYKYNIVDNVDAIGDCKYRVFLKSVYQSYKKVNTVQEVDNNGRYKTRTDTDYVTKELFYLYIKEINTGVNYKIQVEPDFYPDTFKSFVKAVKADL